MDNKEEWATPTLKECPWWRDGMTPEEYDVEREYCYKNFDTPEKNDSVYTLVETE